MTEEEKEKIINAFNNAWNKKIASENSYGKLASKEMFENKEEIIIERGCIHCSLCYEDEECYLNRCKRLEQENKELKEKAPMKLIAKNSKYRSALEEIREKIKSLKKDICNNCGWYNTDNCQPNGYVCHDLIEIKNKINECLGE